MSQKHPPPPQTVLPHISELLRLFTLSLLSASLNNSTYGDEVNVLSGGSVEEKDVVISQRDVVGGGVSVLMDFS
jgi:hypothetical protein